MGDQGEGVVCHAHIANGEGGGGRGDGAGARLACGGCGCVCLTLHASPSLCTEGQREGNEVKMQKYMKGQWANGTWTKSSDTKVCP